MRFVYILGMREEPRYNGMNKLSNARDIMTCVSSDGSPLPMSAKEAREEVKELRESEAHSDLQWVLVWQWQVSKKQLIRECGL